MKPETTMRYAYRQFQKMLQVSLFGASQLAGAWIPLSIALMLCLGCRKPPDLTDCTRIELHYTSGAINYFIPDRRILSEEEQRYVRSLDTSTVSDHELIETFAYSVKQGTYWGKVGGIGSRTPGDVDVVGYRGEVRVVSFTVYHKGVRNRNGSYFEYPAGLPDLTILEPAGIKPLKARWDCAWRLSELRDAGLLRWTPRTPPPYPDPNRWCDVALNAIRELPSFEAKTGRRDRIYSDIEIAGMFRCPNTHAPDNAGRASREGQGTNSTDQAARSWRSDYAMNPNCKLDSPPETVLLFEAKAGWNQHGGPELFTFDNHDPKGGLVVFNDGTRRFIRTEAELKQLRWK